ncbi:Protein MICRORCHIDIA 6 [Camellia lanceoleosa]|uniref:Protein MICRORCHIDIA 6 n=1 Tax=Camellia lanceoleosa TaxID=1840588 RepID=A0ACC0HY15_9ERIC|nr:Protein MICRORCHIDIA 6 [Camellia lanceoleosa]
MQQKVYQKADLAQHQKSKGHSTRQEPGQNGSSYILSCNQSSTSIMDQQLSPTNDAIFSSTLPQSSIPICRQFWKAGNYEDGLAFKPTLKNGSYLHIHPKFLHSNATSHKWAFGAIAELLDNAVDEIQNGATLVIVDKTSNPRDGSPALLIQDDGGGMDPDAMRRCLSFGFSDKKSKSAIGQYGNGFKTSSMRLGADVIVFSRHLKGRKFTQSIGLLSYTFLTQTGHDRIVVPMVDYEVNICTGKLETLDRCGKEHFMSNLSMLLQWSPYSTEAELLQQFDDIGYRGTKVIIYNLWLNGEGTMELDFDSDPVDIRLRGDAKHMEKGNNRLTMTEQHMANQLHYSLRVYLSILYLRVPENFRIVLRGQVVQLHNIASDLKFPEFILYRPHSGGCVEGSVITTIGFLKEAPHVNVHGFNVYHKNRLILPFWHIVSYNDKRCRGVVGVLEANFIEPTHNKQDFEKTSVFQKLENRLKEMTWEYWDYHCGLIGYQVKKKPREPMPSVLSADGRPHNGLHQPVVLNGTSSVGDATRAAPAGLARRYPGAVSSSFLKGSPGQSLPNFQRNSHQGEQLKRKEHHHLAQAEKVKRRAAINLIDTGSDQEMELQEAVHTTGNQLEDQVAKNLLQETRRLRAQCLEYEKREEELNLKVTGLTSELREAQHEYARLLTELKLFENVKGENKVR